MDKKTKFPQSSSKGAVNDSKKTQDIASSKPFPKTSRKREPTGVSNFSKYEQPRRNNAQKAKTFDKRPKPKGQYHGGTKEDTKVVEEEHAEIGSVMVQGSKKHNLNHLLNFHYEPRDVQGGSRNRMKCVEYNRNTNRWLPPTQRHRYNKEQFLQANCQFVVTANGDYTLYLADPDMLVDWQLIEQIKISSFESFSCPICLCPPVAGKMTRCGHVYCWPCILHYLSLSDKSWRKCPICYEAIDKTDLKSVTTVTQNALNVGDKITLRLMRREKGSLLAVPVTGRQTAIPSQFFPVSANTDDQIYSKLLLADMNNIMDIIESERLQLNMELIIEPDSPENCYVEQALNELQKREDNLLQTGLSKSEEVNKVLPTQCSVESEIQTKAHEELSECMSINNEKDANTANNVEITSADDPLFKPVDLPSSDPQTPSNGPKFFYFYQANDGQHLYLHAMNVKMLEMQYGSLEHCPETITGTLLEKEGGSFTEDLRRRLRYLGHLPVTCQFEVAEIELKPPIVSEQVLRSFQDQIELRQKRRQRRERDERRREKKITEEENRRMGKYPTPKVNIESTRHFPEWNADLTSAEDGVPSPPESTVTSSIASSPSLSTFEELVPTVVGINTSHEQGPSFAEMLRNTGTRPKSSAAWPSVSRGQTKTRSDLVSPSRDARDDDDCLPAPSYSQSFGDALAQALEQSKLLNAESKVSNGGGSGKGKKKKKKPTVLFATTMARQL